MSIRTPARAMVARIGLAALVVGALVTVGPGRAFAATIHVPGDYPTIQQALDASVAGDMVLVDPGTYGENLDFHGKNVLLAGTGGAGVTILDAPGGTGVLLGPGGIFQGFTVTGAVNSFGAGIAVSGTGTVVRNDIFDGNIESGGGYGAAIGGNSASPTINANVFRNNSCDEQFLSGVVAFINSSSPRITNNIFEHNPCRGINMTLPEGTAPLVANNTFVDNPAGIRVDARVDTGLQVYRNNIVWGNDVGLLVDFLIPGNEPTWENNLVYGNGSNYSGIADQTGSNGNISVPPRLKDPVNGDYHLRRSSPAIDAGTIVSGLRKDFDGSPRPVDGNGNGTAEFDIGAFEFQPPPARS
jgi:serine protease